MPTTRKKQRATIYEMQAEICAALANPVRLQILDLITTGEKNSTELLEALQLPKANISQHISVLREAGLVKTRRAGLYQFLSLSLPRIKDACAIVREVLHEKVSQEEKRHADLRKELRLRR